MALFDHYDAHGLPIACDAAEAQARSLRAYVREVIAERDEARAALAGAQQELAEAQLELATVTESAAEAERLADVRRDHREVADELAEAIARLTGEQIGEHSSTNDPWANALALATDVDAENDLLRARVARAERALAGAEQAAAVTAEQLAEARQRIAHQGTGYVHPWELLTDIERAVATAEAESWAKAWALAADVPANRTTTEFVRQLNARYLNQADHEDDWHDWLHDQPEVDRDATADAAEGEIVLTDGTRLIPAGRGRGWTVADVPAAGEAEVTP